jgi:AbrB family looped-hinge helix DNA binding protein
MLCDLPDKRYSCQIAIDHPKHTMPATTTLSSKFQITIPKAVREKQHWHGGQEFAFVPKGKGMLPMPVPTLKQLTGIARGACPENYRDRDDRY